MSLLIGKKVGKHSGRRGWLKKLIHFSAVLKFTCKVILIANKAWISRLSFLIRRRICLFTLQWGIFLFLTFTFILASKLLLIFSLAIWNGIYLRSGSRKRVGLMILSRSREINTIWLLTDCGLEELRIPLAEWDSLLSGIGIVFEGYGAFGILSYSVLDGVSINQI